MVANPRGDLMLFGRQDITRLIGCGLRGFRRWLRRTDLEMAVPIFYGDVPAAAMGLMAMKKKGSLPRLCAFVGGRGVGVPRTPMTTSIAFCVQLA